MLANKKANKCVSFFFRGLPPEGGGGYAKKWRKFFSGGPRGGGGVRDGLRVVCRDLGCSPVVRKCLPCLQGGKFFAPGIFRMRKFRAGIISHSGMKIEREISHLPGLFTVQATVPGGPSLVKNPITRALQSDPKSKVCSFFFGRLSGVYAAHKHNVSRGLSYLSGMHLH